MFDLQILADVAVALVMTLLAVLAIYFALRFLGKVARIVVSVVVLAVLAWLLFSGEGVLKGLLALPVPPWHMI